MKTGLIVYVTGKQPPDPDSDKLPVIENLDVQPDALEIITESGGHYDINYVWWALVAKGMVQVICRLGQWVDKGKIRLAEHQLRLCG